MRQPLAQTYHRHWQCRPIGTIHELSSSGRNAVEVCLITWRTTDEPDFHSERFEEKLTTRGSYLSDRTDSRVDKSEPKVVSFSLVHPQAAARWPNSQVTFHFAFFRKHFGEHFRMLLVGTFVEPLKKHRTYTVIYLHFLPFLVCILHTQSIFLHIL